MPKPTESIMVELREKKSGYVASLIQGGFDIPRKNCKRVLWTEPMPTAEQALDELELKATALIGVMGLVLRKGRL